MKTSLIITIILTGLALILLAPILFGEFSVHPDRGRDASIAGYIVLALGIIGAFSSKCNSTQVADKADDAPASNT
jgi:hypothetical protein